MSPAEKFAAKVFETWLDDVCVSIDGADIEAWALEAGLIVQVEVTESCGDRCQCAEFSAFPTTCNRPTNAGKVGGHRGQGGDVMTTERQQIEHLAAENRHLRAILRSIDQNLDDAPARLNILQMEYKLKIIKALVREK